MTNGYIVVPAADAWTAAHLSTTETALRELCHRRQLLAVLVRAPGDRLLAQWQAAALLGEDVVDVSRDISLIGRAIVETSPFSAFWNQRVPRAMAEGWPREALRREWNGLFLAWLEERLRGVLGRRARRAQLLFGHHDKQGIHLRHDVVAGEMDGIRAGTADPFLASAVLVQAMSIRAPVELLPPGAVQSVQCLRAFAGASVISSLTDLVQASQGG